MSHTHIHLLPRAGQEENVTSVGLHLVGHCSTEGSLTRYLVCPSMGSSQGSRVFGDKRGLT